MKTNITYRERKKGNWQYIISYKDETGNWKQKGKQGFEKKSLAKEAAELALKSLKKEIDEESKLNKEYRDITFEEFSVKFLNHIEIHREYNTYKNYKNVFNQFRDLNNLEINKIGNMEIQAIVDGFVKRKLKSSTVRFYVKRLNNYFEYAANVYKIIKESPVKNITIPENKKVNDKKVLSLQEYNKLLKDFENSPYQIVILLTGSCGLRISEAIGMTWDNIDFENKTLNVNRQWKKTLQGHYELSYLKTPNSLRKVPLSDELILKLKEYKNTHPTDIYNRVILYKSDAVITNLNILLKPYNTTIHRLRHTYATTLISNNIDFKTAAKILGHDVTQTLKTYSHVTDEMMQNAAKKINDIFK